MRKRKASLIVAGILITVGIALCCVAVFILHINFAALNDTEYVTNEYVIKDSFQDISVIVDAADVFFQMSEDGECRVVCYEDAQRIHKVAVEDGTLIIQPGRENGLNILQYFTRPKVTVYLPEEQYGKLSVEADTGNVTMVEAFSFSSIAMEIDTGDIELSASVEGEAEVKTDTGRIRLQDMAAEELRISGETGHIFMDQISCEGRIEIKSDSGNVELSDVTCAVLVSEGDTGNLHMTNVISSEELYVKRDTGNVSFEACDAPKIYMETDTGNVQGSLCSGKIFTTEADIGNVSVPESGDGGCCEIRVDTGNIRISVL